jgi:hypothetical protein
VTLFACSAIIGTHRHFWWTETDSPEPLNLGVGSERLF